MPGPLSKNLGEVTLTEYERPTNELIEQLITKLAEIQPTEWLTTEQAATYLGCESVKAFQKIATREGIPKHYLSARAPRYNRAELDAWLMSRKGRVVRG
jgi:hypothetical protein